MLNPFASFGIYIAEMLIAYLYFSGFLEQRRPTWQCLLLGPLYYLVIALPSAVWCNFFEGYRKKNNVSYYKLYCEGWANAWGQKFSGMKMTDLTK